METIFLNLLIENKINEQFIKTLKTIKKAKIYENKTFYQFRLHQKLKIKLKENIINGKTDTLW